MNLDKQHLAANLRNAYAGIFWDNSDIFSPTVPRLISAPLLWLPLLWNNIFPCCGYYYSIIVDNSDVFSPTVPRLHVTKGLEEVVLHVSDVPAEQHFELWMYLNQTRGHKGIMDTSMSLVSEGPPQYLPITSPFNFFSSPYLTPPSFCILMYYTGYSFILKKQEDFTFHFYVFNGSYLDITNRVWHLIHAYVVAHGLL